MATHDENKNPTGAGLGATQPQASSANTQANTGTGTVASTPLAKPEQDAPGTVKVDQDFLLRLQEQITNLQKQNEKLLAVADKNRLAQYEQRNNNDIVHTAKISMFEGKPVLAWRTIRDEVFIDGRGVYHEDQVVELVLEGGTKKEVSLLDRVRRVTKEIGEIVSKTKNSDGTETVKMLMPDGKSILIDIAFLN